MTHGMKNNIALRFQSGAIFTVLNLKYYSWRWVKPLEVIEVEFSKEKCLFEVCKLEMEEERLIAVVIPVRQEVRI